MKKNIKGNAEVVAAIREGFAQNNEILRAILAYMSRNLTEIKNGNRKILGKLDKLNKKIGSNKNSGSSYTLNSNNKNIRYENDSIGSYSGNNSLTKNKKRKEPKISNMSGFEKFKTLLNRNALNKRGGGSLTLRNRSSIIRAIKK